MSNQNINNIPEDEFQELKKQVVQELNSLIWNGTEGIAQQTPITEGNVLENLQNLYNAIPQRLKNIPKGFIVHPDTFLRIQEQAEEWIKPFRPPGITLHLDQENMVLPGEAVNRDTGIIEISPLEERKGTNIRDWYPILKSPFEKGKLFVQKLPERGQLINRLTFRLNTSFPNPGFMNFNI